MTRPNPIPPTLTDKQISYFWSLVNTTTGQGPQGSCWEWQGCIYDGYGVISIGPRGSARNLRAHRLSYFLTYNIWPSDNACHQCDNPKCCNPKHLFEGDNQTNILDAKQKGRLPRGTQHYAHIYPERLSRGNNHYTRKSPEKAPRGSAHGMAKLTEQDVLLIRQTYNEGILTQSAIGRLFGVSPQIIHQIIQRKTWTHI